MTKKTILSLQKQKTEKHITGSVAGKLEEQFKRDT